MSQEKDGTIYIDTKIDTSGFDKGMKSFGSDLSSTGKEAGSNFSKGLSAGIDGAPDPTSGVQSKLDILSSSMTDVGGKMSLTVTAPLVAMGSQMVSSASDMQENINKVDVAFGKSSEGVKAWAETATESFGLSKNQALEATSLFGDMATSMGLPQEEAANMSTSLAGLAGDLASFKNIGIDQAMTALNGVFTGETESLKTLGVVMTETNLKQFADDAGLVYDEMSQAEKVQLRYAYVMEMTKNAQGDYARTSDGTANSMRTLSASVDNLVAELGQNLLPLITPIIQAITSVITKFGEMDPGMQKVVIGVGLVAAAIGPLLMAVGSMVSTFSTLIPLISSAGAAFAPVAVAVGAVVAVVGVLVAAFQTLWKENEGFRESILSSWERIKNAFSGFIDGILERINSFGFEFGSLTEALGAAWNTFCELLAPVFETTFDVIATILETVFDVLLNLFDIFKGIFEGDWEAVWEGIKNIFEGVFNAIMKIGESLMNMLYEIITTIADKIKTKFLDTFEKLKTAFKNIWDSIVSFIKKAINSIIGTINKMISGVGKGINSMISALNGLKFDVPDWVPLIGGEVFSLNIPKVSVPQIPMLATGAVIPPNAPFMAVLGDQRHGTNIEAPEDLIRKIVREESGRNNGNGATYHFVAQLDGQTLFEKFVSQAKLEQTATGKNILVTL